jgi:hypothetical protein
LRIKEQETHLILHEQDDDDDDDDDDEIAQEDPIEVVSGNGNTDYLVYCCGVGIKSTFEFFKLNMSMHYFVIIEGNTNNVYNIVMYNFYN